MFVNTESESIEAQIKAGEIARIEQLRAEIAAMEQAEASTGLSDEPEAKQPEAKENEGQAETPEEQITRLVAERDSLRAEIEAEKNKEFTITPEQLANPALLKGTPFPFKHTDLSKLIQSGQVKVRPATAPAPRVAGFSGTVLLESQLKDPRTIREIKARHKIQSDEEFQSWLDRGYIQVIRGK
jgi:hypothetical protein